MLKKCLSIILVLSLVFLIQSEILANGQRSIVKRDELADEIMNCYEYVTQAFSIPTSEQPIFDDINGSIFSHRILQCYILGFMSGVSETKFEPEKPVTKSQAAVALQKLFSKLNTESDFLHNEDGQRINDLELAPEWAKSSIEFMILNGLMLLDDGNFYPNEEIDETELSNIIERIKNIFVTDEVNRIDFETFLKRMQLD